MKFIRYIILTITFLIICSCTATRELQKITGNKKLIGKINNVIENSGLTANMGIKVISLRTGETLYALNSDHLFNPASNNKLYTAAAALHYLSPQFKFKTSVWVDRTFQDSARVPRLVLVGGGDPDLYPSELQFIAEHISNKFNEIDTLIVDNSLFNDVHYGPGWMWDEGSSWHFAHIDALSFNDNCIDITVAPSYAGAKPIVSIEPKSDIIDVINNAETITDSTNFIDLKVERRWWEHKNLFEINGTILSDSPAQIYKRNIEQPVLFAGIVFQNYLKNNNIEIKNNVIIGKKSLSMVPIYEYYSKSLTYSVSNFLKMSDNLSGELYVKIIGATTSNQQGTWDSGMLAIKKFINNVVQIDTTKMSMVDGSGISRYNLTSPDQLTQLLKYMYSNHASNAEFLAALPTGGWDGSLKNRMIDIEKDQVIRAKTGTLAGVSCLSGYAFTKNSEPLAFSIMMSGYVGSSRPYRKLQDDIGRILVNF